MGWVCASGRTPLPERGPLLVPLGSFLSVNFFDSYFFWVPGTPPPPRGYYPSGGSRPDPPRVFKNSLILPYNHTTIYTTILKTRSYTGFFTSGSWSMKLESAPRNRPGGIYRLSQPSFLSMVPRHLPPWMAWEGAPGARSPRPSGRLPRDGPQVGLCLGCFVVFFCICIIFLCISIFLFAFFALPIFQKHTRSLFPCGLPRHFPDKIQPSAKSKEGFHQVVYVIHAHGSAVMFHIRVDLLPGPRRSRGSDTIPCPVLRLQPCHRISSDSFDLISYRVLDSFFSSAEQIKLGSKLEPGYVSLDWIPPKYFLFNFKPTIFLISNADNKPIYYNPSACGVIPLSQGGVPERGRGRHRPGPGDHPRGH